MLSSKLTVSVHILTVFALKPGESLTSEFLAASVNTNPVVIRRLLGPLRAAGLVESKAGACGGWSLLRDPRQIRLLDILQAVEPQNELFAMHRSEPNPECPCGLHIQNVLTEVYRNVQEVMVRQLADYTIACIASKIRTRLDAVGGCGPPIRAITPPVDAAPDGDPRGVTVHGASPALGADRLG